MSVLCKRVHKTDFSAILPKKGNFARPERIFSRQIAVGVVKIIKDSHLVWAEQVDGRKNSVKIPMKTDVLRSFTVFDGIQSSFAIGSVFSYVVLTTLLRHSYVIP